MAAVSTQGRDPWDQLLTPSEQSRIYAKTVVRTAHVPDDWDDSDPDEEYDIEEDNQKIWADANSKAPMPSLVISPSSTAPSVVSPPSTVFQSTLRILKRPSISSSSASSSAELQTRESLAEREAKYQVARERIFGADVESNECDGESTTLRTQNERSPSGTPVHAASVVRNPRGPEEDTRGFEGRRLQKVVASSAIAVLEKV